MSAYVFASPPIPSSSPPCSTPSLSSAPSSPSVIGNWTDARFAQLFNRNKCATFIFNQMIRCQIHFGGPFYHSNKQFQKEMVFNFSKDSITKAIRLIQQVFPGVERWFGTVGRCLRISHYSVDLEQVKQVLREQGLPDYLDKSDENYPFNPVQGVGSGVKKYRKMKQDSSPSPILAQKRHPRGEETPAVPSVSSVPSILPVPPIPPIPVAPQLEHLSSTLASSYAWKILLERFPNQITPQLAEFLHKKITQHGLSLLDQFVYAIEQKLERGNKISALLGYLQGCYTHSSQTQNFGPNTSLSTLTSSGPARERPSPSGAALGSRQVLQLGQDSLTQITHKPNPEDLTLPPGLEMDALWELEGAIYTVWNIAGRFITLEDKSGVRKSFPLEQVKKGHIFQPLIQ